MHRRLVAMLLVSCLLCVSLVSSVAADVKPSQVPHEVMPGDAGFTVAFGSQTFGDLWIDLDQGNGIELPGGDDWVRFGTTGLYQGQYYKHGVPLGFTFHYMQGPPEPAPGWPPIEDPTAPLPENWPTVLSDKGYVEVFVATNGYVTFHDPTPDLGGMGAHNWPTSMEIPNIEPPNDFVAPYWSDWVFGDNNWFEFPDLCFQCLNPPQCTQGFYYPCVDPTTGHTIIWHERPRGRVLYQTIGTAPNRVFVVEWLNARNFFLGHLATFELQLFEGSNAILFLYKDNEGKGGAEYHEWPAVVIGLEDYYGTTGVGQVFLGADQPGIGHTVLPWFPFPVGQWPMIPAAKAAGDLVGFVY